MFIVKDKKRANFLIAIVEFFLIAIIAEFFLLQIETDGVIEWAFLSFVLFFLTSFFTIKYILKGKTKDYFLSLDLKKWGILKGLLGLLVFVAVMWALVVQLEWQSSIPVSNWILGSTGLMIFFDIVIVPIVVFSKEFFFRGFLMKTSAALFGIFWAILLQAALATAYDVYISGLIDYKHVALLFIPNIFLGYLAYVNRSIFVSALFSWIYILVIDFIFAYKLTQ